MPKPASPAEGDDARFDFFISRTGVDAEWAQWIAWQLEEEGRFSTILQDWDFAATNFVLSMDRAIIRSDRTLVVLSPEFLEADYTKPEWAAAVRNDPTGEKRLLMVVRVRPCQPEGLLASIDYIDLFGIDEAQARERLLHRARLLKAGRDKPDRQPWFPGQPRPPGHGSKPRFPGTRPEVWSVPRDRNPNFSGREGLLDELRTAFAGGEHTIALHGLGGSGKSSTALEYAYRHWGDYDVVWWVRATDTTTVVADLAALAHRRGLASSEDPDLVSAAERARLWLEAGERWLLVFDDAAGPDPIRAHVPRGASGHVLLTSRNPAWGTLARTRFVDRFEPDEAIEFLLERTGQPDREAAGRIAKLLGYLPLALEQAGAYVQENGNSLSEYATLAESRLAELLEQPPSDYPTDVATSWDLSFQAVEAASPAGADLLRLCSFFAPEAIPLDLIREAKDVPGPLGSAAGDPMLLDRAIGALRRYSLVGRSTGLLAVHPLVQLIVRERLQEANRKTWAKTSVAIVREAFPYRQDDPSTWGRCEVLVPHGMAAARASTAAGEAADLCASLLNEVGAYLKTSARFIEARQVLENAIERGEAAHGPDHPNVAIRVNNLGLVLRDLGDLAGARAASERALSIDEATYGPDHPNVATDVNNLGSVLRDLGDLAGARAAFERALSIDEATYGPDHPNVATDVNNLGMVLRDLGDLAGARAAFEQALAIFTAIVGPDHPNTRIVRSNLNALLPAGEQE